MFQTAAAGAINCRSKLETSDGKAVSSTLRILCDAWKLLADSQSALCHTCMVAFQVKSAKLDYLFEGFGSLVLLLQTKCEKEWTSTALVPELEAKQLVRSIRTRLRNFILAVQAEICTDDSRTASVKNEQGPIFSSAAILQQENGAAAATSVLNSGLISSVPDDAAGCANWIGLGTLSITVSKPSTAASFSLAREIASEVPTFAAGKAPLKKITIRRVAGRRT
jgi:hypothetical protein